MLINRVWGCLKPKPVTAGIEIQSFGVYTTYKNVPLREGYHKSGQGSITKEEVRGHVKILPCHVHSAEDRGSKVVALVTNQSRRMLFD